MTDLSKLSDADLQALKAGDLTRVSDAGLAALKGQPAAVQAGTSMRGIPRQLGLTARYGIEGPAQAAEIVTEPLRRMLINPALEAAGLPPAARTGVAASQLADFLGLPSPQGANERVIGDASRLVAGAGALSGGAQALAGKSSGAVKAGLEAFGANPAQQATSAAGAGLAGGSVREAGGSPVEQALAALVGGVAAPAATNAAAGAGLVIKRAITPQSVIDRQAEQQIELVMRNSGIDWGAVSERAKQGLRAEVGKALSSGEPLDADAVRRLLVFKQVPGLQPTRGALTQDPVQITRERNLAKTGANSSDVSLQKLPALENQNTRALLSALDDAGARGAPDAYTTGQRVIGSLQGQVDQAKVNINRLYSAARDSQGRSLPLEGGTFTARANQLLDEANVGSFLPPDITRKLNDIATGKYPLTVDAAEQLKTSIGNLQRGSTDGNARRALGLVRQALDEAPLQPISGGLPAVPGSPSIGQQAMDAFGAARSANRSFMQRVESSPALKAVVDGAEPDQFVSKYITGQGASVADVRELQRAIAGSPETLQAVRQNIVAHLKGAGTGGREDITSFSPQAYNQALMRIGSRKLSAFFSPEELQQLYAVGRAGSYLSSQPAGSAVNNSNSGAMLFARAMDMLDSVSGKLPLGLSTMIQGTVRGVQQRQALNVPGSLTVPQEGRSLSELVGYPAVYGTLLASQPRPDR